MTTTGTQSQDTLGRPDAAELEQRIPKAGIFNITGISALTSAVFGAVGYLSGRFLGRIGDEGLSLKKRAELGLDATKHYAGRGEMFGKWVGGGAMALIGVSVGMRQAREAKEQAMALATRAMELERQNKALALAYTQPGETLISTDKAPQVDGMKVEQVQMQGPLVEKAPEQGIEKK